MILKDVIEHLSMDVRIMINYCPAGNTAQTHRTQVMYVRNLAWNDLRNWIDRKVYSLKPSVDKDGNPLLVIGIC